MAGLQQVLALAKMSSGTHLAEMCQVNPVDYIGAGFEDGSYYAIGWTGLEAGHGDMLVFLADYTLG